jgi:hypothetical protein
VSNDESVAISEVSGSAYVDSELDVKRHIFSSRLRVQVVGSTCVGLELTENPK